MRCRNRKKYRIHKEKIILGTVHSDVHEFTSGKSNFKYIVTFRDEASRYGKVYFMRQRSEVPTKFKEYKALVESERTRYGSTPGKILRLMTDGAGEYESQEFNTYLKEQGIER